MHKKLALALALFAAGSAACSDDDTTLPPSTDDLVITTEETLASGAEDQSFEATLSATGGTEEGYRWSVIQGQLPANVFLTSSGTPDTVISGTPRNNGIFTFTIQVEDSDGETATKEFTTTIAAAPPPVSIVTEVLPEGATDTPYSQVIEAMDGSGEGYRWSLVQGGLPPGLDLVGDTITATISGSPEQRGAFSFRVRVEDSKGDRDEATYTIVVQDSEAPIELRTQTIPNGQVNVPFSPNPPAGGPVILESQGGKGTSRTWSIVNGDLPPGVTLEVDSLNQRFANLSGVPTQRGNFSFRVRVEDEEGNPAERTYFTTIERAPPRLNILTVELPDAREGVLYTDVDEMGMPTDVEIEGTGGSGEGYMWAITGGQLPPGLEISPEGTPNATISGTPTMPGTFDFEVTLTDSLGNTSSFVFTVRVAAEIIPISITSTALPNGVLGRPYTASLTAENGFGNYNWVLTEGELPPGIELQVPGTPSTQLTGIAGRAGTFTATITVFDLNNNTASRGFSFEVVDLSLPLEILPVANPTVDLCQPVVIEITGIEGSNIDYMWSIDASSPDQLPAGFVLEPTGTPTTRLRGFSAENLAGTYDLVVRVEDSSGRVATRPISVTITNNASGGDRVMAMVGDMFADNRFDIGITNVCQTTPSMPMRASPSGTSGDADTGSLDFAVSPDGTMVAFIGDYRVTSFEEVYIADISGATPSAPIIVSPATSNTTSFDAFEVLWAPDSDHLVFLGDFTTNGVNELYAVDTSGPIVANSAIPIAPTLPTFADVDSTDYSFSFDGRYIAFLADTFGSSDYEGWVYDLDSGTQRTARRFNLPLASDFSDVNGFAWSPVANQLVYNCDCDGVSSLDELFQVDVTQANLTSRKVNHALGVSEDVRSPFISVFSVDFGYTSDGQFIWYLSGDFTFGDSLYALSATSPTATGTRLHGQLTNPNQDIFDVFPAAGSLLVARGDIDIDNVNELFLFDASLPGPQDISSAKFSGQFQPGGDVFSVWVSPNGQYVGFIADRENEGHNAAYLYDVVARGSSPRISLPGVTNSSLDVFSLWWSPASNWVAIYGDVRLGSVNEVWAVNAAAGAPYPSVKLGPDLPSGRSINAPIVWRGDGGGVLYEADIGASFVDEAYWVDINSPGEAVRVTNVPSGGDIFYIKRQGQRQ